MFGWNYPPGVTGTEYAICGPDWEREEKRWCATCERDRAGMLQGYRRDTWFVCDSCGEQTEIDDAFGDEDDEYDRAMDSRLLEGFESPPGDEEFAS
ncbi:MAG: hypothetical protein ACREQM_02700 [Candidatus Dormibacteraceae bacterium]